MLHIHKALLFERNTQWVSFGGHLYIKSCCLPATQLSCYHNRAYSFVILDDQAQNCWMHDLALLSRTWKKDTLTTLVSGHFWRFSIKKNTEMHVTLRRNFSCSVSATDLVETSKDAASLLDCTWKKTFWLGVQLLCDWCHKWRAFRAPSPTLPGPGRQPLDGRISLKFLLETRL